MKPKLTASLIALGSAALVLFVPPGLSRSDRIRLNQHFVEDVRRETGAQDLEESARAWWSAWRGGVKNLFQSPPEPDAVDFEDPRSVLTYVLDCAPPYAIVYPTETYYYYRFHVGHREVSGNLRLLDADRGEIHVGYFDADDGSKMKWGTFDADDGLTVDPAGDGDWLVRLDGREVRFHLARRALEEIDGLRLLDYEQVVSGILDESAVPLVLLYNEVTSAFYYVLNEQLGASEELAEVETEAGHYFVGKRTRFVYHADEEFDRKLLVGVAARSVSSNDYYDGPFDQVPPRLQIRERLEASYPYVTHRGGIDEHGNFVDLDHQRVAISPYTQYGTVEELLQRTDRIVEKALVKADLWSDLTHESKRDFHERIAAAGPTGGPHAVFLSAGWPANHHAKQSLAWNGDHEAALSSTWPPDHEVSRSTGTDAGASDG